MLATMTTMLTTQSSLLVAPAEERDNELKEHSEQDTFFVALLHVSVTI